MLRHVANVVRVHQSEPLQNNTVVVRGSAGVLLVDPGITGDEMACLAKDLAGEPVVAGFATHPHWDHVLWSADLGEAPRYGTARCAADLQEFLSKAGWKSGMTEWVPPDIADDLPLDLFGLIAGLLAGTTHLPWDGPRIRIIEHQAHAPGHAALLIEEHGVLVAGDMLSDVLIPMLDTDGTADPVDDYLAALQLFDDVAADVQVVVPGHGSVGGADELRIRIDQDRAYVQALRDNQEITDPRIGSSAKPGWQWVTDVHTNQLQRLTGAS
ncbi:MBL fold metallo-hydrolase [Kribbella pratensis]|uniref:Glyoxylase-like metal-dependent hydrolase (Beta-lactamase superfamily II) n=1 Tax=Kribbella pratensis TaxID=2512112 RepID=A0A4V6Q9I3_9ACTN|nr:MBL fold metallo-hydrolase [Kribbella pratensis]TDW76497.1 glyoxylase-like metal-dependent hydrolase (beta-lactamase superfamily II) [Kribbella pratensis]